MRGAVRDEGILGRIALRITTGLRASRSGTGAAPPVVAELAKRAGAFTVGVATQPFDLEGATHMRQAERGIAEMRKYADSIIVVPNERLLAILGGSVALENA